MMLHAALRQYRGQSAQESSKLESSRYLMKLVQNYAPTDRKALSPLLLFASITPPVVVGFSLILRVLIGATADEQCTQCTLHGTSDARMRTPRTV
eukprot:1464317-Rhodomonas_salina.4